MTAESTNPSPLYATLIAQILDQVQHLKLGVPDAQDQLIALMDHAVVQAIADCTSEPERRIVA